MDVQRIAAFSNGSRRGNPAGVVLCDVLPNSERMQAIAAEVGCSETAFAAPIGSDWRARYFAPEIEVPFCGHATIALGAALALRHGDGIFNINLSEIRTTVEGTRVGSKLAAALQSPPTRSAPAAARLIDDSLALFSYSAGDLDPRLPPRTRGSRS
jgi:PhzF family phenazine biosynthesis protein